MSRRSMSGARHDGARRLGTRGAARKRQQGDVARALDGHAQPTLVARANSGHAPWENLAAFLHELRQNVRALIVDEVHLLDAKLADFFLAEVLALSPLPPARAAGTPWASGIGSAFTPRPSAAVAASAFAARRSAWGCCLFRIF